MDDQLWRRVFSWMPRNGHFTVHKGKRDYHEIDHEFSSHDLYYVMYVYIYFYVLRQEHRVFFVTDQRFFVQIVRKKTDAFV